VTNVSSDPWSEWAPVLLVAVVVAILVSAGLLIRAKRVHGKSWVKAHVAVKPRASAAATFDTPPSDGDQRDHILTVIPVELRYETTVHDTTVEEIRS